MAIAGGNQNRSWEEYKDKVWQAVTALEFRHDIRIAVELINHRDEAETGMRLAAIEAAAASSEHEVQRVESPMGASRGPASRFADA
ncbi:MAG: hypothetical protein GEV28_23615 [Actinophytocola sp.]|uniref:hypothetical protein n=1 Tax=Actinophytocola sp. TaxID=1872138 RepID=UPI00132357D1|nr:hypothetical protein [Actinophytocola sp.]MPZ83217.1 hypothetical protein [Actinophytocola sp.]